MMTPGDSVTTEFNCCRVEAQEITHTSPSFTLNSPAEVQSLKFCEVTSHDGLLSVLYTV